MICNSNTIEMTTIDDCSPKHWDMIGRNGCAAVALPDFVEGETEKSLPTMFGLSEQVTSSSCLGGNRHEAGIQYFHTCTTEITI